MTRRRTFAYVLIAAFVVLLAAAHGASAASSQQIWTDAADGVIDNDYSIADLRAANAGVPAELAEYGGWDEIYRDALRRKANPKAPVVVVPRDKNGNGKIDAGEKAEAVRETRERNQAGGGEGTPVKTASPSNPQASSCDEDEDSDTCNTGATAADEDSDDDSDDDGRSPLVWLVIGLPVVIILFGAVRMLRSRRAGDSNRAAAPRPERFDPPRGGDKP